MNKENSGINSLKVKATLPTFVDRKIIKKQFKDSIISTINIDGLTLKDTEFTNVPKTFKNYMAICGDNPIKSKTFFGIYIGYINWCGYYGVQNTECNDFFGKTESDILNYINLIPALSSIIKSTPDWIKDEVVKRATEAEIEAFEELLAWENTDGQLKDLLTNTQPIYHSIIRSNEFSRQLKECKYNDPALLGQANVHDQAMMERRDFRVISTYMAATKQYNDGLAFKNSVTSKNTGMNVIDLILDIHNERFSSAVEIRENDRMTAREVKAEKDRLLKLDIVQLHTSGVSIRKITTLVACGQSKVEKIIKEYKNEQIMKSNEYPVNKAIDHLSKADQLQNGPTEEFIMPEGYEQSEPGRGLFINENSNVLYNAQGDKFTAVDQLAAPTELYKARIVTEDELSDAADEFGAETVTRMAKSYMEKGCEENEAIRFAILDLNAEEGMQGICRLELKDLYNLYVTADIPSTEAWELAIKVLKAA